jgi:hypothetical protein
VGGGRFLLVITFRTVGFKDVMVPEPYKYTWYLRLVMAGLPYIKIKFQNHSIAFEIDLNFPRFKKKI